ncbi:MAG: winged helix-turn-helix domain-containing protein [Nitrososphaerota archaeon]
MADKPIKRLFSWLLLSTRGGPTRLLILLLLRKGSANANQIANSLHLHYKTVQYHLEVLLENKLVEADDVKYDVKYRLSPLVLANMDVFESLIDEIFSHREEKVSIVWDLSG